ncbi:hypothetical protein MUK42_11031 [Musa troglodytarum]|uniref:Uncharacterized protein n=1 Tax=Musa troglodytarum TaxID=320322 RepID=A0A9E7GQ87_9LILI|nr:hypothetical protein MUK42_11031 [Musa troglodytarum]
MHETLASDSLEKRLRLQNEVLKWLSEFSEKLHQRAKDTEMEVNGLFGQAGAVELDLKNTKISDEDGIACHPLKDHAESSVQDMTDPVAYAASDFKAMLEAALLNQYKFHDEESLSVKDILRDKMISGQIQTDVVGTSGERQVVSQGTSEQLNRTIEEDKPVAEGNFCSLTHPQELYSALLGGSLFDNDEDVLCSGQKDSTDVSTYDGESNSWRTDVKGKDTSMCSDEEEGGQRARWQVVNSDERQKPTAVKPEDDVSSSLLAVVGDEILSAN